MCHLSPILQATIPHNYLNLGALCREIKVEEMARWHIRMGLPNHHFEYK
jgi:hypothetical protein